MKKAPLKSVFRSAVFFGVLIFAAETHFAQNGENKSCLAYEPATVSLKGMLARRPVVDAAGRRQSIWVLRLAAPACVDADPANEMNAAARRITEMQLVLPAEQIGRMRALVNRKVELRGTLFAAHTQHHFTEVLLAVGEERKR